MGDLGQLLPAQWEGWGKGKIHPFGEVRQAKTAGLPADKKKGQKTLDNLPEGAPKGRGWGRN